MNNKAACATKAPLSNWRSPGMWLGLVGTAGSGLTGSGPGSAGATSVVPAHALAVQGGGAAAAAGSG